MRAIVPEAFRRVLREEQLEQRLAGRLSILKPYGYDLELIGRQVICSTQGGRIDLLCRDRTRDTYVVIELKVVRAGRNTAGQVMAYMGWVQRSRPKRSLPLGLVIAPGFDVGFEDAVRTIARRVDYLTLGKLDLG